ncbi:MAG: serine/threonine protein kinase [Candidatus Wallbacteria bacterium]|nr:serine/threonine protein kinase [Candidatus Wallbacteria bacterium]
MASASSRSIGTAAAGSTVKVSQPRKAVIGIYKILGRPLGRGGSATVYKVQGQDGAIFAVKELAPQFLGDKDAIARFRREFEITRELDHPGIVRTHELLEANGTLNIRMELVDGVSLKALLSRQKRLSAGLACWIASEIARTLSHAHKRGIIHRDVKPDNILLARDGRVLLGDFGTARLTNLAMTRAGTLLGTPVYMAPELLSGKKDSAATAASDVYSLGAVVYEAIEGRSPFASSKRGEILPLLYAKSFQKLKPMAQAADSELAQLVEECLAKEPARRPPGMRELLDRLTRHAGPAAQAELRAALAARDQKPAPAKRPRTATGPVSLPPAAARFSLRGLPLHDSRFAAVFFATLAGFILYLLSITPAPVQSGAANPTLRPSQGASR